ncbi:uncharacterized protein L203_103708 [Cryptococcus depauperatus CBS 7841]|uniref:Uncharacterized protein n=1 Tax=Cryptococcus depauperatus CBS 7841 TaxID=1295531 RepID=A0A1E3IEK4_9TREE|nr:hypothetical protein L203_03794 [Cryptococcus depauperatus CBS 7841]
MSVGAVILINGYPGVGKLSTAKHLAKLLPNSQVLENHLMEDAACSLFDKYKDSEAYNALRQGMRKTIFRSILVSLGKSTGDSLPIYILTESLPASPTGLAALHSYFALSSSINFTLVHIVLTCSTEENIRRLACPTRKIKSKLTDESVLIELRMEEDIAKFHGDLKKSKMDGLGGEFEIDTERTDVRVTAGIVGEYVLDALRGQGLWLQLNRAKR